jgi:hypothetical protein
MTALKVMDDSPSDPSEFGFPATLPLELALKEKSVPDLCKAYGIGRDEWDKLRRDPLFISAVGGYVEELKKDGMSFKLKARLQAEVLLATSFKLIHSHNDDVPPQVKADLIKFTIRAAGLDGSKDQAQAGPQTALQININLG